MMSDRAIIVLWGWLGLVAILIVLRVAACAEVTGGFY
jgi:hypothetical protein